MTFHARTIKTLTLAAVSGLALLASPAFAQGRTDANGMPTDHSTPAEKAQTAELNAQIGERNRAADAKAQANDAKAQANDTQYQAQQRDYQEKMETHQIQQSAYEDNNARYNGLRARYAAERAGYRRAAWPHGYESRMLSRRDADLVGERLQLANGRRVGTVTDTAHAGDGSINALRVRLDNDRIVWIDAGDVRYNRADGIVMTNLDRNDLRRMSDQRL